MTCLTRQPRSVSILSPSLLAGSACHHASKEAGWLQSVVVIDVVDVGEGENRRGHVICSWWSFFFFFIEKSSWTCFPFE